MRTPDISWHQIVRSEGCITGALKLLCHRAAVGLLRATEALGGCDIEGVMHAVLGEQGRARAQALVRESEVDTHMELRQQVANLTETNVRLERAVHTHTHTGGIQGGAAAGGVEQRSGRRGAAGGGNAGDDGVEGSPPAFAAPACASRSG